MDILTQYIKQKGRTGMILSILLLAQAIIEETTDLTHSNIGAGTEKTTRISDYKEALMILTRAYYGEHTT